MGSHPKRHVMIGATRQVEPIRIGELLGVAVRSAQQKDQQLLWPDPPAGELYLLRNTPDRHLNRGIIAQQLLRSRSDRLRVLPETSELFRMSQQGDHSIVDGSSHVPGSCMNETHAVRENLVFSRRHFVRFHREAVPNYIVGEVFLSSGNHRSEVLTDCSKALHRPLCL